MNRFFYSYKNIYDCPNNIEGQTELSLNIKSYKDVLFVEEQISALYSLPTKIHLVRWEPIPI